MSTSSQNSPTGARCDCCHKLLGPLEEGELEPTPERCPGCKGTHSQCNVCEYKGLKACEKNRQTHPGLKNAAGRT